MQVTGSCIHFIGERQLSRLSSILQKKKQTKKIKTIFWIWHIRKYEKILRNDLVCQGACAQTGSIVHFRSPTHRPRELNPLFILFSSHFSLSLCCLYSPTLFPALYSLPCLYINVVLVSCRVVFLSQAEVWNISHVEMSATTSNTTHRKKRVKIRPTISFSASRWLDGMNQIIEDVVRRQQI